MYICAANFFGIFTKWNRKSQILKDPKRALRDMKFFLTPFMASRDPAEGAKLFFPFWDEYNYF